jgi:hypothetical protein
MEPAQALMDGEASPDLANVLRARGQEIVQSRATGNNS